MDEKQCNGQKAGMLLEIECNLYTTESPGIVDSIQSTILSAINYLLNVLLAGKNTKTTSLEINA